MPVWLHRTTKELLSSVAEADLQEPATNYIEDPDLSAVLAQPIKYWVITGDTVSLMSQSEMDTVDANELSAQRDDTVGQLDLLEDILRAFALTVLDEINLLRSQHSLSARTISQLKTSVRNKLGT